MVWLFFTRRTDLFDGRPKRMLHIAPEECLERRLRACLDSGYLTADLDSPRAMVKMDITDIQYPDGTFDVIYCSHVLEHVPEDGAAMREMRRVLKPSGWAVPLVPIRDSATIEDLTVTDPAERLRLFGQDDHVRSYGPDFVDRLRAAGFEVTVSRPSDLATPDEVVRMGLTASSGQIFHCTQSPAPVQVT